MWRGSIRHLVSAFKIKRKHNHKELGSHSICSELIYPEVKERELEERIKFIFVAKAIKILQL